MLAGRSTFFVLLCIIFTKRSEQSLHQLFVCTSTESCGLCLFKYQTRSKLHMLMLYLIIILCYSINKSLKNPSQVFVTFTYIQATKNVHVYVSILATIRLYTDNIHVYIISIEMLYIINNQ